MLLSISLGNHQLAKSRSFDLNDPFNGWVGRLYTDWRFSIPWENVGGNVNIRVPFIYDFDFSSGT